MLLDYFTLDYCTNPKVIGPEYPQIGPDKKYDFKAHNSYVNVKSNFFPSFSPNLNNFRVHKKAPLTDFLSSAIGHGLIVNEKVKTIFGEYNMASVRFYPMGIKQGNREVTNYYWMHLVSDCLSYVDFKITKIQLSYFNNIEKEFFVRSAEELHEIARHNIHDHRFVSSYKIFLKEEFMNTKHDLFKIPLLGAGIYISSKVKTDLLASNCTGIDIKSANLDMNDPR